MNKLFEYAPKERAPLGELVKMCDVALALVQERRELFKFLRMNAVSAERSEIFHAALKRLQDLEQISDQLQLAFRDAVSGDSADGIEHVWEKQGWTLFPDGSPAVH